MPHVTFIHGIANKPEQNELLTSWRRALALDDGIDLDTKGISSSMIYWADVMYATPAEISGANENIGVESLTIEQDEQLGWQEGLSDQESAFVAQLSSRLNFDAVSPQGDDFTTKEHSSERFEAIPLPWFIKRRLMKVFLRDVHHYLFNTEHSPRPGVVYRVQDEIRKRFIAALRANSEANAGDGPHILLSHSMGTVISYDCLKRVADCPKVDGFMTIGSPLGLSEVQHKLKPQWTRNDGYPGLAVLKGWDNVYDRLDPVALDARITDDFKSNGQKIAVDHKQLNRGKWRHSASKYLGGEPLRAALSRQLQLG